MKQADRYTWLALAALSAALQFAFVAETNRHLAFQIPVIDSATYHNRAVAISRGEDPMGSGPFQRPPLYQYWLAKVYACLSDNVTTARYVHVVFAVLTALLTFAVANRIAGETQALAAALVVCLYGPLVFYFGQLLPNGMSVALDMAVLLTMLRLVEKPTAGRALACGAAFGIAALAVPNILMVMSIVAAWLAYRAIRDRTLGRNALLGLVTLAGAGACILPVTLRNGLVSGQWTPISANAGINLYIGNNPDAEHTMAIRPGMDWDALVAMPLQYGARTVTEAQSVFMRKVRSHLVHDPIGFGKGLVVKAWWLCNAREIPRNVSIYAFCEHSPLLRLLVWRRWGLSFPFGIVGALGILGLLTRIERRWDRRLVCAFIVVYALSVVVFFPTSRYKLPLLPPLIIFAVLGAEQIACSCRRSAKKCLLSIMLLAGIGAAINLPVALPTDSVNFDAELHMNLGRGLQVSGKLDEAIEQYDQAIALEPTNAQAHYFLGTALRDADRKTRAIEHFRQCLKLRSDHARAMFDLALILSDRGHDKEAMRLLRGVLSLDPNNRRAMTHLGMMLYDAGRVDEAQHWLDKGGALPPGTKMGEAHARPPRPKK